MKTVIIVLCTTASTFFLQAQTVYNIPFASSNNKIELTIANASSVGASDVTVAPGNVPSWLKITPEKNLVKKIDGHKDEVAQFTFSVDKTAPVKRNQELTFSITTTDGQKWTKKFMISVRPPDKFGLFQNYPNPFNPTTTISYLLPQDAHVTVKIYSTLGEEVRTLVNDDQSAGYQSATMDASSLASGVYFYRVVANSISSESRRTFSQVKKLMVMK